MKLHSANDSLNTHTNQIMWRAIELILRIRMARLIYVWCQVDQFFSTAKGGKVSAWFLRSYKVRSLIIFVPNSSFGILLLKQREEATCHYSPSGSQNLADLVGADAKRGWWWPFWVCFSRRGIITFLSFFIQIEMNLEKTCFNWFGLMEWAYTL